MVSCADFLRDFSDYHDGEMDPAGIASMEAHLAGCSSCSSYVGLLEEGIREFRSLPAIEPSYDFVARLQHRIYSLDNQRLAAYTRRDASRTSALFVAVVVMLVAAAAWWPQRQRSLPIVELPPVAAVAPKKTNDVHALFRPGPLLAPAHESGRIVSPAANTVFFRYAPLSTYAGYPMDLNRRR